MPAILEKDLAESFIGKEINGENLTTCAMCNRKDPESDEYIIYSCSFMYKLDLKDAFGVTDKLKDLWERRGTEFNIHLYVSDSKLVSCKIFKYKESSGARPSLTTPKCTQQELRVARRILDYVTK